MAEVKAPGGEAAGESILPNPPQKTGLRGMWRGRVSVRNGESRLCESEHRAPLKVAKPFRRQGGEVGVCLMDASPGLFNGDAQRIECRVDPGASAVLATQSACQLHPSRAPGPARQTVRFDIAPRARLEYLPEPVIPFAGAWFRSRAEVHLATGGQGFLAEILSPGRVGRGERFAYRELDLALSVYLDGKLAALDRMRLRPGEDRDSGRMFGGYTHLGTLWILSDAFPDDGIRALQSLASGWNSRTLYGGCSRLERCGAVVRVLGRSADGLRAALDAARAKIRGV